MKSLNKLLIVSVLFFFACKSDNSEINRSSNSDGEPEISIMESREKAFDTKLWQEITSASGILLDLKYASEDNFTKRQIYDCGRCFLRKDVAKNVLKVQQHVNKEYGYNLKLFDCYRPLSAQQKLWNMVPNANYVSPPDKGSMHNRGMAVDLTFVDAGGEEIDMGTPFDFFGERAHHDHTTSLENKVISSRRQLKSVMEKYGFRSIRTEWWHYSYKGETSPVGDWEWECE